MRDDIEAYFSSNELQKIDVLILRKKLKILFEYFEYAGVINHPVYGWCFSMNTNMDFRQIGQLYGMQNIRWNNVSVIIQLSDKQGKRVCRQNL
jgi:hypothetical protein